MALLLITLVFGALNTRAADSQAYTYCYQLKKAETESVAGSTVFKLYVARTGTEAPALYAGRIALGTKKAVNTDDLEFDLDPVWKLLPHQYIPGATNADAPTTSDQIEKGISVVEPMPYLSFGWGEKESDASGESTEPEEQDLQYIGSLTVKQDALTVDDIVLLPYPETKSGKALIDMWKASEDKPPYLNMIESVWRMDDDDRPESGFYQGYFASEKPKEEIKSPEDATGSENGLQFAVDITNGWQSFRVQSFNPHKDVMIEIYTVGDAAAPVIKIKVPDGGTTPGRTTVIPDLTKDESGDPITLAAGKYRMTVRKSSHVSVSYEGLTVTDTSVFPELQGILCYLPCGDVSKDDAIKLWDRALLTKPGTYGKSIDNKDVLDLDGDGYIGQRDLAILIDPANYGKSAITIVFGDTEGGTT